MSEKSITFLLLSLHLFSQTSALLQNQQPLEDFNIDPAAFARYISLLQRIIPIQASGIDFDGNRAKITQEFTQQIQDGLFPQPQTPNAISFYAFRGAVTDTLVRTNIYMPQVRLSDLLQLGRDVITGDMDLRRFISQLDLSVPLTSENTFDANEQYYIAFGTTYRSSQVYPAGAGQNMDEGNAVEIPLKDLIEELAQLENDGDRIPNSQSISGPEIAIQYIVSFQQLAQDIGTEPVLNLIDYVIRSLEAAINYNYRVATVRDPEVYQNIYLF